MSATEKSTTSLYHHSIETKSGKNNFSLNYDPETSKKLGLEIR